MSTKQFMTYKKQREKVKYFKYLGYPMQDVHVDCNPELSMQKQHSTRRRFLSTANMDEM